MKVCLTMLEILNIYQKSNLEFICNAVCKHFKDNRGIKFEYFSKEFCIQWMKYTVSCNGGLGTMEGMNKHTPYSHKVMGYTDKDMWDYSKSRDYRVKCMMKFLNEIGNIEFKFTVEE